MPGTKIVCGVGPLESDLRKRHPNAFWMGVLPRHELANVYAACDVFVFPSRHETFGLVMLEAMSAGTPVAAYPVDGPLQVLSKGDQTRGGVLNEDLREAALQALHVPRVQARERALDFGWQETVHLFLRHLVPVRPQQQSALSRFCHGTSPESVIEQTF